MVVDCHAQMRDLRLRDLLVHERAHARELSTNHSRLAEHHCFHRSISEFLGRGTTCPPAEIAVETLAMAAQSNNTLSRAVLDWLQTLQLSVPVIRNPKR